MRLLMSTSDAPFWHRESSVGSLMYVQFTPDGLVAVGIWPISSVAHHESGSGDHVSANMPASNCPVARMPPDLKLLKNLPAGQLSVVTEAPTSFQLAISCSSSAAR